MLNASSSFKKELYKGNRDYLLHTDLTLADGAELPLEDSAHMEGGLSIEDAVSSDGSFDIGAAIVNKCVLTLNNIYDDFSAYDFTGAEAIPYVGLQLPDGTVEALRKGTFTVEEAKYNGSVITLTCLDNMTKFDKPYSESPLTYPATLGRIVRDACERCGVQLGTLTFPNDDFIVQSRPSDGATTFREVISWAAQIACCFCRCDAYGRLELKWYDQEALETAGLDGGIFDKGNPSVYESGDDADGGGFNPWSEGAAFDGGSFKDLKGVHSIYSIFDMDIDVDDVVITGARVTEKTEGEDGDALTAYQAGKDGYVISVEGNALIQGGAGEAVAEYLGERLIGFRFRRASATHLSDPTMEAGDVGFLTDRKGNARRIVISNTKFTAGDSQRTSCNAQTPARNSATRYSAETKNYVEYRKALERERATWELALKGLADALENGSGLYQTEEPQPDGSVIRYFHDKPAVSDSKTVIKITGRAVGLSNDGGKTYPYGIDFSGRALLDEIYAIGLNAKYINAGALSIRTQAGKETFYADTETGKVRIVADSFSLTSGKTIEGIAQEKAEGALSSANAETDKKLKGYSTTAQMNSAINQAANQISLSVSSTYETKTEAGSKYAALESKWTVTDGKIEAKVSKGDISSLISQEAGKISIKSNRLSIDSTNFKLTEAGAITATSGTVGGFTIGTSKIYATSADSNKRVIVMQAGKTDSQTAFAAGGHDHSNYSDCPFRVSMAGKLYASGADITGIFKAKSTNGDWLTVDESGISGGHGETVQDGWIDLSTNGGENGNYAVVVEATRGNLALKAPNGKKINFEINNASKGYVDSDGWHFVGGETINVPIGSHAMHFKGGILVGYT